MSQFNNPELVNNLSPYFVKRGEAIDTLAIDKQVIAGDGLTGGGLLTSDVTLNVIEGDGINVLADSVELQPPGTISTDSPNTATSGGHTHIWDTIPDRTYTHDLGTIAKKYGQIHAGELWVDTLVAQNTLATIGGRILVGPTTTLTRDLGTSDTTLYVEHNQMAAGDVVYLEKDGQVEFLYINSASSSGSELLTNSGFETAGGGTPVIASWPQNLSDGNVVHMSEPANRSRQRAYIYGDYASASSQQAYLAGPGIAVADSLSAYIEGTLLELVTDGSLENWDTPNDPTDWDHVGAPGRSTPGRTGTYYANLDEANSSEISQTISVLNSSTYDLSFYSFYLTGGSVGRYAVYDVTNSTYLISNTLFTDGGDDVWTLTTDSFTTASNTAQIRLEFKYPTTAFDNCGVDDVSLVIDTGRDYVSAFIEGVYHDYVYADIYSAKLVAGSSADTYIRQDEAVTAGETYNFSFWTRGDGRNAGRYRVQNLSDSSDIIPIQSTGNSTETYTQVNTFITIPAGCNNIRIFLYCPGSDGGAAYFDAALLIESGYYYTIVRDLDGSGADSWNTGDAVFNTGIVSEGFIDLYSVQGVAAGSSQGPTIVGNVRTITSSEILQNTGFETAGGGGADIWANWSETAGDGALANETSIVNSGSDAAKITTGVSDNTKVEQAQTVTGSTPYVLRMWTRGDGATAGRYGVWDYTNSAWIVSQVTTGVSGSTYTEVVQYFVTPATCVSAGPLIFAGSTSGDIAYFDDITMQEVDYNDWIEHWAIGNLNGLYGETSDVYAVAIGRYGAGYNHIKISDDAGVEIWVGDESTTDNRRGQWDVNGDFYLGQITANSGNLFYDVDGGTLSGGRLNFRGGSGGTTIESYIDDDGGFYAGGGKVRLDSDGLALEVDTVEQVYATVTWHDGTNTIGKATAYYDPSSTFYQSIDIYTVAYTQQGGVQLSGYGTAGGAVALTAGVLGSGTSSASLVYNAPVTGWSYFLVDGTHIVTDAGALLLTDTGSTNPLTLPAGGAIIEQGLRVGDVGTNPTDNDIRAVGDIVAGDGLYAGNVLGEPGTGQVLATGDIRTAGGLTVGNVTTDLAVGYATFTAGIRVGDTTAPTNDDIRATADIVAGGGLYAGSVGGEPANGDVWATGDARIGSGLYVGGTGTGVSTGYATFTGGIRVGDATAATYNDDITCTGGIVAGTNGTNPVAGNIHATAEVHVGTKLFVNDTANGELTYGLTIKTTDASETISLKEGGCNHGMTSLTELDTYGAFREETDNIGGLVIDGFTEDDVGLRIGGWNVFPNTTTSTAGRGNIEIRGATKSGTTETAMGSSDNVLVVRNASTTELILKGNGALHVNVSTGSGNVGVFDSYNDMALLGGARALMSPKDHYLQSFSQWIDYARPILEETGVITIDGPDSIFMNVQGMFMLTIDTIRQMHARLQATEQALLAAGIDLPALPSGS
jgi:hypothetical protein